jgi:hypothetical protein
VPAILLAALIASASASEADELSFEDPSWYDEELADPPAQPAPRSGAGSWGAAGFGMGVSVWARPGLAPTLLMGDQFALEVGHGPLGLRGQVGTVRLWNAVIGVEGGAMVLVRPGREPLGDGVVFGFEGAGAITALGNRYLLGPTVGLRGRTEARLTVAAVGVPRLRTSWTALGSTRYGLHVGVTVLGVRGW